MLLQRKRLEELGKAGNAVRRRQCGGGDTSNVRAAQWSLRSAEVFVAQASRRLSRGRLVRAGGGEDAANESRRDAALRLRGLRLAVSRSGG
jgi:hypothetical protein